MLNRKYALEDAMWTSDASSQFWYNHLAFVCQSVCFCLLGVGLCLTITFERTTNFCKTWNARPYFYPTEYLCFFNPSKTSLVGGKILVVSKIAKLWKNPKAHVRIKLKWIRSTIWTYCLFSKVSKSLGAGSEKWVKILIQSQIHYNTICLLYTSRCV